MSEARPKRLILAVIDGLGSAAFDRALRDGHAPMLQQLTEAGAFRGTVVSPFPSLTPVCMSSIVTGTMPHEHRIPSLCWFHRGERRYVEYGSSLRATAVEGTSKTIEDVVVNLNHVHLAHDIQTIFESIEDTGLVSACVNCLVFRGRTRHSLKYQPIARVARRAKLFDAVYGPSHFYHGELFGTPRPLVLPQVGVRGIRDWSAAHLARWIVRNTETDFLLLYLGGHDIAAHKVGPESTTAAVRIADRSIERVIEAMGGLDQFLRDAALIVVADHGQTKVERDKKISLPQELGDISVYGGRKVANYDRADLAICPSNRFAAIYRLHEWSVPLDVLASRVGAIPGVDLVAFLEEESIVVERHGARLVATPTPAGLKVAHEQETAWALEGDPAVLDLDISSEQIHYGSYPDALARLSSSLRGVYAGDLVVSAEPGWEFVDLAGQHHGAGGSHGSLHELDSLAPLLAIGVDDQHLPSRPTVRLGAVARMVRHHFGIDPEPV